MRMVFVVQKSYTRNYVNIYFWKGLAIVLNLISMFIVMPKISQIPSVYGIYALCVSMSIFLQYADIGFISAAFKYASESYARGEKEEEVRIVGFISSLLFTVVCVYMAVIFFFAAYPHILMKDLTNPQEAHIASQLLCMLALFAPTIVLQKASYIFFGVRLEDYILQRFLIIGNSIKIISVFYFFYGNRFDIVGYYLFSQIINFISCALFLVMARFRYGHDFRTYFKTFRFSKLMYHKLKKISHASFYLTLVWILIYELDMVIIARLFGAADAAYYGVALMIFTFLRTIYGLLYSPYSARINHFIGIGDSEGLKAFLSHIISITTPLVVFPILSIVILAHPLLYTWVGSTYDSSIVLLQWLVISYFFAFLNYVVPDLLIAQERIKTMYIIGSINVCVYWVGIVTTFSYFGIMSFVVFKFSIFAISAVLYAVIIMRFLKLDIKNFFKKFINPIIIPCICAVGILLFIEPYMPLAKNKLYVMIIVISGIGVSGIGLVLYSLFSAPFRSYVHHLYQKIVHGLMRIRVPA